MKKKAKRSVHEILSQCPTRLSLVRLLDPNSQNMIDLEDIVRYS